MICNNFTFSQQLYLNSKILIFLALRSLSSPIFHGNKKTSTWTSPPARGTQDWYVRYGGAEHLDLAALQRAVDRLVQRHSALRTTLSPDAAVREAMDRAAGMWQLMLGDFLDGQRCFAGKHVECCMKMS